MGREAAMEALRSGMRSFESMVWAVGPTTAYAILPQAGLNDRMALAAEMCRDIGGQAIVMITDTVVTMGKMDPSAGKIRQTTKNDAILTIIDTEWGFKEIQMTRYVFLNGRVTFLPTEPAHTGMFLNTLAKSVAFQERPNG
jgi:hypothetical protein